MATPRDDIREYLKRTEHHHLMDLNKYIYGGFPILDNGLKNIKEFRKGDKWDVPPGEYKARINDKIVWEVIEESVPLTDEELHSFDSACKFLNLKEGTKVSESLQRKLISAWDKDDIIAVHLLGYETL